MAANGCIISLEHVVDYGKNITIVKSGKFELDRVIHQPTGGLSTSANDVTNNSLLVAFIEPH